MIGKIHFTLNPVFQVTSRCNTLLLLIFKLLLKLAKVKPNLNQVFAFITLSFMTFQGKVVFLIVSGALRLSQVFLDDIADSWHAL